MRPYILPLALLFIAFADLSSAQSKSGGGELQVVVEEGAPLTVECSVRVEQRAVWRVDGDARALAADLRAAPELAAGKGAGRLAARLHAPAARAAHAGLYTCAGADDAAARPVRVRVLPHIGSGSGTGTGTGPAPTAAPATAAAAAAGLGGDADADADTEPEPHVLYYELNHPLVFNCTSESVPIEGPTVQWSVNGTLLERLGEEAQRRYEVQRAGVSLLVKRAREDDWGNYSCSVRDEPDARIAWQARARPVARLPADSNVVEGQTLALTCKLIGKPYRRVVWSYAPSVAENATELATGEGGAEGGRVRVRASPAGVPDGVLEVRAAERGDAGVYSCVAEGGEPAHAAATTVRVKDVYAALWPFLGICLEVFVLCAVILVYEKRRTKPELDDSDADTHDQ